VRRLTRIAAGRSKTASKEVEVPLETFHEARIAAAPGLDEAPVGGHGRSAWSMLDRWPAARGGRSCARRAGWYRAGCGPGRWPEQRGSDASGKASATAAAMPSAPSAATSTTPSHRGSDRDRSASTGARPRPRWTQRGPGVSRAARDGRRHLCHRPRAQLAWRHGRSIHAQLTHKPSRSR
jgi:hypothetical protein